MKLLCIKIGKIEFDNYIGTGEGLKLGKEYTTKGEPFTNKYGYLCYFIEELQDTKLVCRFTKALQEKPSISFEVKLEESVLN